MQLGWLTRGLRYIVPTYPTIKEVMERLYPPELGPLSDIPNTGKRFGLE